MSELDCRKGQNRELAEGKTEGLMGGKGYFIYGFDLAGWFFFGNGLVLLDF